MRQLSAEEKEKLIDILKTRFEQNLSRHKGLEWPTVQRGLEAAPQKLWSLNEMEKSGGEPDVVSFDPADRSIVFFDCSAESPKGRRSLCYDREALESRKEHKPAGSALETAEAMGAEMLDEEQYRFLQSLGSFDSKTSSWLKTPPAIRRLGGALFGDRRYDHVFVYHNSAESYYAARGFRCSLTISF